MSGRYEELSHPRFKVETASGGEQITIRAQRQVFAMLFLTVWLGGWTVAGVSNLSNLMTNGLQPFLIFWMGGWALGELFVAAALCWMLTGSEITLVRQRP